MFTPISRPDKHAELLKIYLKLLVKRLKISTLVAKSNLRFKVHLNGRKIIRHEPVNLGQGYLTLGI